MMSLRQTLVKKDKLILFSVEIFGDEDKIDENDNVSGISFIYDSI